MKITLTGGRYDGVVHEVQDDCTEVRMYQPAIISGATPLGSNALLDVYELHEGEWLCTESTVAVAP